MNLTKLLSLFLVLAFSNVACAEDPTSIVPKDNVVDEQDEEHSELKAVTFTGQLLVRNPITNELEVPKNNPKSCTLQITMMEEEEEEHEHDHDHGHEEKEHGHHMIAQIAEKSPHGESIPAMEIAPYYLDKEAGKYVEEAPQGDFVPTLVGLQVDEKAGEPDVNKLAEYIQEKTLVQSFQFTFSNDVDFEAMEEALEETLESENKNLSAQTQKAFGQMTYLTVKQFHINHIDNMFCTNFKLDSVTSMVEFEFEHEHEHEH